MRIAAICLFVCLAACACHAAVPEGSEAQYYIQPGLEGQEPQVTRVRVVALQTERVDGKLYQWWEMTLERRDGRILGVRVLSREVPLTSASAPGDIARYIFSPPPDTALEYRDERTGKAVLPRVNFVQDFLPQPQSDTGYAKGFANVGKLHGHVLVRCRARDDFPKISFANVKVLNLRTDLLIGSHVDLKCEEDPSTHPLNWKQIPYVKADYEEMITAGANYFRPQGELRFWLQDEPVYFHAMPHFPDDFYRSNYFSGSGYLDEPMIRFGWAEGVPTAPLSPEAISGAIRTRVQGQLKPEDRVIKTSNHAVLGDMELIAPLTPVWETEFTSAWYQMEAGVSGFTHEGRYRERGYGYFPEMLFGEGLENLTDDDMFAFYFAYMRGASRAFGSWWGISIYSEGDPRYRIPAMIRAYDKGASTILFWVYSDINYNAQLRWIRALSEHARRNPRPSVDELVRKAEVGIVLPRGYLMEDHGIRSMDREQINDKGVSYGDIAAAAQWEGILCSRQGIEYDFLVDHDGIEKLGYKQLRYVQTDATIKSVPARRDSRAPKDLKLSLEARNEPRVNTDVSVATDHRIGRAGTITLDGDFSEWAGADWITLDGDPYIYTDNYFTIVPVKIPDWVTPESDKDYMGFTYAQMDLELRRKYGLEFWPSHVAVIVTSVTPGSPADEAGLREGDAIMQINGIRACYEFEIYREVIDQGRRRPGVTLNFFIKRNPKEHYTGSEDLSARLAFLMDDSHLYIAVEVTDDVHQGYEYEPEVSNVLESAIRMGDCVQVGIDPISERLPDNYGENGHEIGLALSGDDAFVWRWKGRRGQPKSDTSLVPTVSGGQAGENGGIFARRVGNKTIYEAAIPLSEFAPLAPDMWSKCGINIVVNDSDGSLTRKSRLELRPWAMTDGKRPKDFAVFELPQSSDRSRVSAAIFWDRRCLQPGGSAEVTVSVKSPETRKAVVRTTLRSIDDPKSRPVRSEIEIPVSSEMKEHTLRAATTSPPGRYRLAVEVVSPDGRVAARDELPIYIYH